MDRILNHSAINGHGNVEGRLVVSSLLETGLSAADPYSNAKKLVRREGNHLYIGSPEFEPIGSPRSGVDVYDLSKDIDRIYIFAAGKGIWRAISPLIDELGPFLTGGHAILKHGDEADNQKLDITYAGHPIPDKYCVEGAQKIVNMISEAKLTSRDLVFTIIGNGVSSLLTLPADGLTLEDVKECTRLIQIERGFSTPKLNLLRNQIDKLKGGRITRLLHPAKMVHIVTIDVNEYTPFNTVGYQALVENNSWLHTLPDMTTVQSAKDFLTNNEMWEDIPVAIKSYLLSPENNSSSLTRQEFEKMDCRIFGLMPKELSFIPAIMNKAKALGYEPHLMTKRLFQEASAVSGICCSIARLIDDEGHPFNSPCLLIFAGEMLVTVDKNGGVGGRNQEFCLTAANAIRGRKRIVIGSVDTDGTDGPGGYFNLEAWDCGCHGLSGGIVDGYTALEASRCGIDIDDALRHHSTSDALWQLNCGVWASQNISVNDIILALIMDHDG